MTTMTTMNRLTEVEDIHFILEINSMIRSTILLLAMQFKLSFFAFFDSDFN